MEIVHVTDVHQLAPEDGKFCEATKAWFKIVPLSDSPTDDSEMQALFDDIRGFYAVERVPAVFRWMARDRGFLQSYWEATRETFSDLRPGIDGSSRGGPALQHRDEDCRHARPSAGLPGTAGRTVHRRQAARVPVPDAGWAHS